HVDTPATAAPEASQKARENTVELDQPIRRGDAPAITALTLRRPDAGSLRGVSLMELAQLDVNALQKVLPRICTPLITSADVRGLDPADLFALGAEVARFLTQKKDLEAFQGQ